MGPVSPSLRAIPHGFSIQMLWTSPASQNLKRVTSIVRDPFLTKERARSVDSITRTEYLIYINYMLLFVLYYLIK